MNSEISEYPAITQFSRSQRRVLGVLLEKGFTTPDSYPLTIKSLTTGCNQKSNRDPVTNYTEDALISVLDELREMGVVAAVHTDTGRSERFRHYMRKRFKFSEKQLAILTELFLRGRQTLGELRARASRMVAIESLDILRSELEILKQDNYIVASGSLERRGIEVDHNFYLDKENKNQISSMPEPEAESGNSITSSVSSASSSTVSNQVNTPDFQEDIKRLTEENEQLKSELQEIKSEVEQIKNDFIQLKSELGG